MHAKALNHVVIDLRREGASVTVEQIAAQIALIADEVLQRREC